MNGYGWGMINATGSEILHEQWAGYHPSRITAGFFAVKDVYKKFWLQ
jgi:hypothetical protein